MTVTDQIFRKVAEASIPHFFITVEFAASGTEMPEHIESFLREKHEAILRGASGRKFIYKEGEWRLIFTFFPTGCEHIDYLPFNIPHKQRSCTNCSPGCTYPPSNIFSDTLNLER